MSSGGSSSSPRLVMPFVGLDRAAWIHLLDKAALFATVLVAGAMILSTFLWFGVDFRAFYAAGRLLLNGQDPYDYELTVPILIEISGEVGNAPFYYPPWFALLMAPFALLPYDLARIAWLCFTLALWGASVWLTCSALQWQVRGWRLWLGVLSMLYLLVWVCIRSEQTGPLVCLALASACWAMGRGRPVWAGIALAWAFTKPQIAVLAVAVFFAALVCRGIWKSVISLLATLAVLSSVSLWAIPGWYRHLARSDFGLGLKFMIEGPGNVIGKRLTSTLPDLLWAAGIPDAAAHVIWGALALLGLCGLLLLGLGKADLPYRLAMSLPIWFMITPYSMQYDYVLLTFSTIWAYRELGRVQGWRKWLAGGTLFFLHSLLLWERLSVEGLWLPAGMALLLIGLGWGRVSQHSETLWPAVDQGHEGTASESF